ncbi:MAG TPA: hypothetical protein VKO20_06255 [Desulfosalsimonadaceae bacterium]|nr:hypothetical protein [Desulfosalsimonadaceae bacterium]
MAESTEQRRRSVEKELMELEKQVDAMDGKLRAYLADRQNKPHPRHMELVEKIQRYRVPPAVSTKQLEYQLDNLQWKVYYHQKAWQQLWENAEAAYRQGRQFGSTLQESPSNQESERSQGPTSPSMQSFWDFQQKKLKEFGARSQESAEEFENRIRSRYRQLAENKGDDQEIVLTFDKQDKQCTLALRRKE